MIRLVLAGRMSLARKQSSTARRNSRKTQEFRGLSRVSSQGSDANRVARPSRRRALCRRPAHWYLAGRAAGLRRVITASNDYVLRNSRSIPSIHLSHLRKVNTRLVHGRHCERWVPAGFAGAAPDASHAGSVGIKSSQQRRGLRRARTSALSIACSPRPTPSMIVNGALITSMDNSQLGVQHFSSTPTGDTVIGSVVVADSGSGSPSVQRRQSDFFQHVPPLVVDKTTVTPVGALSPADIVNGVLWGMAKWDSQSHFSPILSPDEHRRITRPTATRRSPTFGAGHAAKATSSGHLSHVCGRHERDLYGGD